MQRTSACEVVVLVCVAHWEGSEGERSKGAECGEPRGCSDLEQDESYWSGHNDSNTDQSSESRTQKRRHGSNITVTFILHDSPGSEKTD